MKQLIESLKSWAEKSSEIETILIVGSYAQGTNKPTSDLDLVFITPNKADFVQNPDFVATFGEVQKKQIEYYGANTSIRVWYADGKEVEFGIVKPSWLAIPLDDGTRRVLSDGYKVIFDRKDNFRDFNQLFV